MGLQSCNKKHNNSINESSDLSVADSLKISGLFVEAEQAYRAEISQKKDPSDLLPSILALAEIKLLVKENSAAKNFIDSAQFLVQQVNTYDSTYQLMLYVLQAEHAYNTQAYEKGITVLENNRHLIKNGDRPLQMRYYLTLGSLYRFGRNDYTNAEKYLLQARELLESHYPKSLYHPILFYRLAATARLKSDFDMGINYGRLMLSALRTMPKRDSALTRLAYSVMANIYSSKEEYQFATLYYDSSVHFESTKANSKTLATILNNKAFAEQKLKQYSRALSTYNQSLKVLINNSVENHSDVHMNLAYLHRVMGRYDSSLYYYRKVKHYRNQHYPSPSPEKGYTYYRYASLLKELNKIDSSLFYIQKAIAEISRSAFEKSININPSAGDWIDKSTAVGMLSLKGALLKEKYTISQDANYLNQSVVCYNLANNVLKSNAALFANENTQLINISHIWPNLAEGIDVLNQYYEQNPADHIEEVYDYVAGTKSQLMLSRLNKQSIEEIYLPNDAVIKLRQLKQESAYWQVSVGLATTEKEKENLTKKTDSLERERATYNKALSISFPAYANAKVDSLPTLKNLEAYCAAKNKTIIDYTWSNQAVYGLSINASGSKFFNLGKSDVIKVDLDSLLFHLEHPSLEHQKYAQLALKLYNTLLGPILAINHTEDIIIIADNALLNIPFDALLKSYSGKEKGYKELDYLLHTNKISYALSITSVNKTTDNFSGTGNVLGMAYGMHANDPLSLSNSESEIDVLASYSDGVFLNQESCTKENFFKHATQASIIHLAVHGKSDTNNRYTSYLQFPNGEASEKKLYTFELYRHYIPSALVVLSTCESGAGTYEASEGMYSLARGFLSAGAQAVMQSLWKLNDQASLKVFENFYKHLEEGKTFSEGLRLSKQQYLQSSDNYTSHPAYWAGLVFIGEDGTTKFNKEKDSIFYSIIFGLICISAMLYIKMRK
ncbi:CHAT domain-containing protein [Chryseotalea sanaruensis]|uniref:CHAT domain-containing protein n=1 Tax=Chryseotalea sanaruensis TaxID=2482724 RepID=A0A401UD22_9BACT|nr:CHAT domain-containing tetratricopeptide repeat protein [Chryseotalea sanaruensis]GCC52773.1 CHAT domain-containing protein [Chryseotalea sanaruensis]